MAARSKADIVSEARNIARAFQVDIVAGEHVGSSIGKDASGAIMDTTMTFQQAMIRLQLLQLEVLIDINRSEAAS
jgi:hypothetical protein